MLPEFGSATQWLCPTDSESSARVTVAGAGWQEQGVHLTASPDTAGEILLKVRSKEHDPPRNHSMSDPPFGYASPKVPLPAAKEAACLWDVEQPVFDRGRSRRFLMCRSASG